MLRNADYAVDYLASSKPEKFKEYKLLYFPYYTMLDSSIVPYLKEFLENGGIVIADEGFGMRTKNTWMQPYDIDCKPLMTARLKERRLVYEEFVEYNGVKTKVRPYKSEYAVENAETVMEFSDGAPAVQAVGVGKGKLYLFGFSIGYSYLTTGEKVWKEFMEELLSSVGAEKYELADAEKGVYERRLKKDGKEIVFLFNNGKSAKTVSLKEKVLAFGGFGTAENGEWTVLPASMAYAVLEK